MLKYKILTCNPIKSSLFYDEYKQLKKFLELNNIKKLIPKDFNLLFRYNFKLELVKKIALLNITLEEKYVEGTTYCCLLTGHIARKVLISLYKNKINIRKLFCKLERLYFRVYNKFELELISK